MQGHSHDENKSQVSQKVEREETTPDELKNKPQQFTSKQAKKWGYKNIYGMSISLAIVYTAYYGLASLQSSINPKIGLISLSLTYGAAFITAFFSPSVLKLIGTKYSILAGYLGYILYILANLYPAWFVLLPSAVATGLTMMPMWAGLQSHSRETAVRMATVLNKDTQYLIGKFSGIFFAGYISSYIVGNLVSSLILFPYNRNPNNGSLDIDFNHSRSINETAEDSGAVCDIDGSDIDQKLVLILTSIYAMLAVVGIIVLLVFVDRLPTENKFISTKNKLNVYFRKPLTDIFSVLKSVKMCLMASMMTLWGLELSFAVGTFTEVYISSCFGTYLVGFTIALLGASSAFMCWVYGKLLKHIPRIVITQFGVLLMIAILVFLLVWERVPSYTVIFSVAIGWGISDAIVSTSGCISGILFPKKSEGALSANLVWEAVAVTVGYAMGKVAPTKGFLTLILIVAVIASVSNFILEFVFLRQSPLTCCKAKQNVSEMKHSNDLSVTTNQADNDMDSETEPTCYVGDNNYNIKTTVNGLHFSCDASHDPGP